MNNNKRLLKNTIFSYGKMFISMFVALYSTRILLNELGESDYGLYNVIAGIVLLFNVINTTMAVATTRNITFSLGKNDIFLFRNNFSSSIIVHFILGFLSLIFLELIGNYLLYNQLNIGDERVNVASILLQFVILSTVLTVTTIPFTSLIIAKEDLHVNSLIGIVDTLMNLFIAIIIQFNFNYDKLLIFGLLTLIRTLIGLFLKFGYSFKNYSEFKRVKLFKDYTVIKVKELFIFSFWNLLGVLTNSLKTQGVAVVLNIFFGTIINTAYAITNQINGQLQLFSATIIEAVQPQMIKSEAINNYNRQKKLLYLSSEIMFIILATIALPFIINANYLLKIWLVDFPKEIIQFTFLVIIITLIKQFKNCIEMIAIAKNKVKQFQILNFPFQLLILPIGYTFFKLGYSVLSIFYVIITIEIISFIQSIYFLGKNSEINPIQFFVSIVLKNFILLITIFFVTVFFNNYLENIFTGFILFLISSIFSVFFSGICFYIFINKSIKNDLLKYFKQKILIKFVKN